MDPITMGMIGAGVLGGGAGLFGGMSEAEAANRAIKQGQQGITNLQNQFGEQSAEVMDILNTGYAPYTQGAGQNFANYQNMVNNMGGVQYADADPFAYNLQSQSQQFLDPSMDFQIKEATDAVQGSAANAGKLFSSSTGRGIAARAQDIAQKSWKDAMNMAITDRGFQYGVYGDEIDRDRANVDLQLRQEGLKLDALGNIVSIGADATTNLTTATAGVKGDEIRAMNDAELQKIMLGQGKQDSSFFGNLGGALTGAAGGVSMINSIMGPTPKVGG
jgi:hypothetical protein